MWFGTAYIMTPADRSCSLKLLTTSTSGDTYSWYKLWEAANAIYYMCISIGFRGTIRNLGNSCHYASRQDGADT